MSDIVNAFGWYVVFLMQIAIVVLILAGFAIGATYLVKYLRGKR